MTPRRRTAFVLAAAALILSGLGAPAISQVPVETARNGVALPSASRGLAAIARAARANRYVFLFFWKDNDEQTGNMFAVFQSAMQNMAPAADSIAIQITDPTEKATVDKYGVGRAPMPLALALAPNGAVTKGLPVTFTEEQLREAFVSPGTARCMKALQDRKLVLLCVQNAQTRFSRAAWQGVQAFKADARFASATEVVAVDPGDRRESAFLQTLQVDPRTPQAITVLLTPPGQPIARFTGAVTKDLIVAKVSSSQSGWCPGGKCGPGGCGPKK